MNFPDLDTPASSMFDPTGPSSFGSGAEGTTPEVSAELQEFLAMEQEKARMRMQVQAMTDLCWDKCMGQPSAKMESKTEGCLENCAQRFVDVTLLITQRFATMLQRQSGGM